MINSHSASIVGAQNIEEGEIDHLITPVRGVTIVGLCIDPEQTVIHEDMIRVTKTCGKTQIDIAVVVPPVNACSNTKLFLSLKDLLTNTGRNFIAFINKDLRLRFGIQVHEKRPVLVATYVLQDNLLIQEDFDYSFAVGEMMPAEKYNNTTKHGDILDELRKLLTAKPYLKKKIYAIQQSNFPKSRSEGFLIAFIATQLFNETAFASAKKRKIPFIRRPYSADGNFTMNSSGSIFSRGLRDPCGFVNASNFSSYFLREKFPFPRKLLRKMLPFKEVR